MTEPSVLQRLAFAVGLTVVGLSGLAAQMRTFDVASIKRVANSTIAGDGAGRVGPQPGGRFVMEDGTATVLVRSAYPEATEVIGAPDWAQSEHYDVEAKPATPATDAEIREMLRALMADRFKLEAHMESREKPTYSLVVDRTDRRLGPALKKYEGDCAAWAEARRQGRSLPQMPVPSSGGRRLRLPRRRDRHHRGRHQHGGRRARDAVLRRSEGHRQDRRCGRL
jgi:uncharacterized protein (TIGR03435 family)